MVKKMLQMWEKVSVMKWNCNNRTINKRLEMRIQKYMQMQACRTNVKSLDKVMNKKISYYMDIHNTKF